MGQPDQVVWITGASDGIGAALARVMARRGARLILTARRQERLEEVALACGPAEVVVLPADLTDPEDVQRVAAEALAAFGRVDVLVNNAGVGQRGRAIDTGDDVLRRILEVNFFAATALTRAVLPGMLERGSGRVAAVSSLAGHIGTPLRSGYAASKFALEGWFESLRAELHGSGVSVTVIAPGYIQTDITVNALGEDGLRHGRMGVGNAEGLTAAACAERMADALEKRRDHVFIGGREVWGVYLKRWAPWLVRRNLHRAAPEDR